MVMAMPDRELTKEEVDQRARDLARRVMSAPPQPRTKPKPAAKSVCSDVAKPRKRGRAGAES